MKKKLLVAAFFGVMFLSLINLSRVTNAQTKTQNVEVKDKQAFYIADLEKYEKEKNGDFNSLVADNYNFICVNDSLFYFHQNSENGVNEIAVKNLNLGEVVQLYQTNARINHFKIIDKNTIQFETYGLDKKEKEETPKIYKLNISSKKVEEITPKTNLINSNNNVTFAWYHKYEILICTNKKQPADYFYKSNLYLKNKSGQFILIKKDITSITFIDEKLICFFSQDKKIVTVDLKERYSAVS